MTMVAMLECLEKNKKVEFYSEQSFMLGFSVQVAWKTHSVKS